jgi:DNA-binding transcriptional MerR regulator
MPKGRVKRRNRHRTGSSASVEIPENRYFRIGEVSELAETKPYVLRYWETEFPMLKPTKSPSGHRLYRREDVEMVLAIKRLLYEQGFTIEGARKHLSGGLNGEAGKSSTAAPQLDGAPLRAIQHEIEVILTMLSRKC